MFTRVEVKNFRSLRSIDLQLSNFHVLTGPNGTGKTTLLDVFGFLADLMNDGLEAAIEKRTNNYYDLTFAGSGEAIYFALEASVPEHLVSSRYTHIRYQLEIKTTEDGNEIGVFDESLILFEGPDSTPNIALLPSQNSLNANNQFLGKDGEVILQKNNQNLEFRPEKGGDVFLFQVGNLKAGLANMLPDSTQWPITLWLKNLISRSIRTVMLDSYALRQASPYAKSGDFNSDGSRLPWMIEEVKTKTPRLYAEWISHIRTALPDLKEVKSVLREDDRHRYIKLVYENGIECPSWVASDGTLRLLALTLIVYMDGFEGMYLIEEPENGIHPLAIETVFASLSHFYDAQVLVTTHSPLVISLVRIKNLLCFKKRLDGSISITDGPSHPHLQDEKDNANLSLYFASGILD